MPIVGTLCRQRGHLARSGKEEPYDLMVVAAVRCSGMPKPADSVIAHGAQDAYPAFNLSTISVAAAGQAFVNPKKGPKSRDAAKPGKYRPTMDD